MKHRIGFSLLAVLLVVAACGGDDDGSGGGGASGESDSAACPEGGDQTLDVATYVEPLGLDPLPVSGGSYGGLEVAAIYDTLMRWNPESREYEPWVAEGLEPNDDFTEWTLTLRDGVTFSNGDPLTSDAVKASIERFQAPANRANLASLVAPITAMEVVDPTTLVFRLDAPWTGFPFALANAPGMVTNPAVVAERGEALATDPAGAGVGPYEVSSYAPGEELVLTARDDYWGGPVCVPELRFIRISGGTSTYDALQNGEVDVALFRDPRVIEQVRSDETAEQSWIMNLGEVLLVNHGVQGSNPVTTDVRIRRAVAAAIDTEMIDDRINEATGLPTSAIVAPDTPLDPGVEGPEHDPDLAASLVEEAKADGWDGSIRVDCDNAPNRREIGVTVEAQLEAVGFEVELNTSRPINDHVTQVLDADYDLACWALNVSEAGAWAKLDKQLGGTSPANFAGFVDDEWDQALTELRAASSPEDAEAAIAELQERANEVVPVVDLAAVEEVIAWRDGVDGITPTAESLMLFGDVRLDG